MKRTVLLPVVGMTAVIVAFLYCLPRPLFQQPYAYSLYSKSHRLLGARIAADGQWRFAPGKALPAKFKTALVQFEDKRFYRHIGIDPLAMLRALLVNIKNRRVVSGGSTLSMQVIRLAQNNPPRTVWEKLREAVMALRLEMRYDKSRILSLWAHHAPFGGNVIGIDAAAWRYFGRDIDQLSWAESCLLAVLPNSPALMHPGKNRRLLKAKRDRLIRRLEENGVISADAARLAVLEPLPERPRELPRLAPHLLDTLIARHPRQYRIVSSIDDGLQQGAMDTVRFYSRQLGEQGIHNAAALVVDNRTFKVLAYVGNSQNENREDHGYAVDIIQRPRSTGSLLKPFLYAAMLQHGDILPTTLVPDVPTHYAGYTPKNYDRHYRGAVPAREALARSLNIPAVRMLERFGVERFYDLLQHMGMGTLYRAPRHYGLALILGGAEGSLWDLTTMYANLAYISKNRLQVNEKPYRILTQVAGQPVQSEHRNSIGAASAWLTLNALVEVSRPGLEKRWRQFAGSRKIAWKTGTSFGMRDGWAIGSTSRYTVGVWVGNASGEGRPHLTGLYTAAPIMFELFNRLPVSPWFDKPMEQLKQVRVCQKDGYLAGGDCPATKIWVPEDSHFQQQTPHYPLVHLSASRQWQVHSGCESVAAMQHRHWFVLPPDQAYYYRQQHADYRPPPPWRADCTGKSETGRLPFELVYPQPNTQLYIPVELSGDKGKVVFSAVHQKPGASLFWHVNNSYLGATTTFHQMALRLDPGRYQLTLVDETGQRLTRPFQVLGKSVNRME